MRRTIPLAAALLLLAGCAALRPRPEAEPATPAPSAAAPGAAGEDAPGTSDEGPSDEGAELGEDAVAPEGEEARDDGTSADALEPAPDLPEDPDVARTRARILAAARKRLGTRPRLDCSGFVLDAYRAAGVKVPLAALGPGRSRSESLHVTSRPVARPRPGDLAFFHDTYDRNRDGKRGDLFTHVALVEAVVGDVVTLLHRGKRIERIRMDLARPSDPATNDILRIKRRRDAPGTRYLAGELFTAFGELLDGPLTRTLQEGHAADTTARHPAPR